MSERANLEIIAGMVPPRSRVLDLGCGNGELLEHLQRERGCSGYGVEIDDANVLDCYRRAESIVPQQALTLSNSKFALNAAGAITSRMLRRIGNATDEAFITEAFAVILADTPTADEKLACQNALAEWRAVLQTQKHADPTAKARENLVAALLNHNDFVTVR